MARHVLSLSSIKLRLPTRRNSLDHWNDVRNYTRPAHPPTSIMTLATWTFYRAGSLGMDRTYQK